MMKPFSKNLFSQMPVAFGWLPEETINLDISALVCEYLCASMCVCVTCLKKKVFFFFLVCYDLLHCKPSKCKSIRRVFEFANMTKCSTLFKQQNPWLPKQSTPYRGLLLLLTSLYTFTPARSPDATQKHLLCQHLPPPVRKTYELVNKQGKKKRVSSFFISLIVHI